MSAIGPLTTAFRAPASCTRSSGPQVYQIWTGDSYSYVQGPVYKSGSNCFPKGYDPSPSNYYSPGFCPQGYTSACSSEEPVVGTGTEAEAVVETAVVCCPTGIEHTCGANPSLGCQFSANLAVIGATVVKDGKTGTENIQFTETGSIISAYAIHVRMRATDAPPVTSTPITDSDGSSLTAAATGLDVATSQTRGSLPAETSPGSGSSEAKQDGVSTATAIGIGVGSAAFVFLVALGIGLFFYLRWRRKRRDGETFIEEHRQSQLPRDMKNRPPVPPKDYVSVHYELSEYSSPRSTLNSPRSANFNQYNQNQSMRISVMPDMKAEGDHLSPYQTAAELEAVVPQEVASSDYPADYRSASSIQELQDQHGNASPPGSTRSRLTGTHQENRAVPAQYL